MCSTQPHGLQSPLLRVLQQRGYVYQASDLQGLDEKVLRSEGPIVAYAGFDCTAPSLHVGSLVQIMMLRWLQRMGHKPIVLIGGGTTRVGDPSFRGTERPMLSPAEVARNADALKKVFASFLTLGDGPTDALLLDNADWLLELNYIDFLRDYGAQVSVNRMLSFESVKTRLEREQSLSFLEFNYMLLQAYDFLYLARHHGCCLQLGGSDQWGNMVLGVELGRKEGGHELFALTSPLLTTRAGEKMGKTAKGAVWLDGGMLPPYDYWQYWRDSSDADLERFLYLFTDLAPQDIRDICTMSDKNAAKEVLATQVTGMLHGSDAAGRAQKLAEQMFGCGEISENTPANLLLTGDQLRSGIGVLSLCVDAGLCETLSQARRHVQGGALRVNDQRVGAPTYVVTEKDLRGRGFIKISIGKKRHAIVQLHA